MKKSEFKKVLKNSGVNFKVLNKFIVITDSNGSVYLESLTTLPDNVKFENHGSVYLRSLTGKTLKYRDEEVKFLEVDNSTMIILNKKEEDGVTIYNAKYFGGGKISDLKQCYIAEKDGYSAHGETEIDAIDDVNFKILSENFDKKELINIIIKRGTVTGNDYRLITGACRLGVKQFKEVNNITERELPLERVLNIIKGEYGSRVFAGIFDE